MKERALVVRGRKIDSRSGKVKTYDPDRKCEVCGGPLSKYNPSMQSPHRCWLHRIRETVRIRGVPTA